jgi:tetratricopeptide (TPR) repeat protein
VAGLGLVAKGQGYHAAADLYFQQAVVYAQASGNRWLLITALLHSGDVARAGGDIRAAHRHFEAAYQLVKTGQGRHRVTCILRLADIVHLQGDLAHALALDVEALQVARNLDFLWGILKSLLHWSNVVVQQQREQRQSRAGKPTGITAVHILGATEPLLETTGIDREPLHDTWYQVATAARAGMPPEAYEEAFRNGSVMSLDLVVRAVLATQQ